jgi:hypothetical protein
MIINNTIWLLMVSDYTTYIKTNIHVDKVSTILFHDGNIFKFKINKLSNTKSVIKISTYKLHISYNRSFTQSIVKCNAKEVYMNSVIIDDIVTLNNSTILFCKYTQKEMTNKYRNEYNNIINSLPIYSDIWTILLKYM